MAAGEALAFLYSARHISSSDVEDAADEDLTDEPAEQDDDAKQAVVIATRGTAAARRAPFLGGGTRDVCCCQADPALDELTNELVARLQQLSTGGYACPLCR